MSGVKAVETALLDHDEGSYRDVNFVSPTWDGLAQFLKYLERQFEALAQYDGDGNSLKEPVSEAATSSAREGGGKFLDYGVGAGIITNIRVLVSTGRLSAELVRARCKR